MENSTNRYSHEDLVQLLTVRLAPTEEEIHFCALARESWDEDLELGEQPTISIGEGGAYVSAWVWVPASC